MEAAAFRREFVGADRFPELDPEVTARAATVLEDVRTGGDAAVARYTEQFDGVAIPPAELRVSPERIREALERAAPELIRSLEISIERIRDFHRHQSASGYATVSPAGSVSGQLVRPLARAGLYVPGGRASYPSSLIMNAIPAQVAGVPGIVVCTPPGRDGSVAEGILVAAGLLGVEEMYRVGGVQAVGAMAYGTETLAPVDKIVGPGNSYVTAAKKLVYGRVGIDGLAGPSELAVVCDGAADPVLVALDLLAQAEHDPEARVYLLATDASMAQDVLDEMERLGPDLDRWEIIDEALSNWGGAVVAGKDTVWELTNALAPEHLSIQTEDPWADLGRVRNAGAVFLGAATAVSFGDYSAGPNHVLPTAGTARYASPLGVADFYRRSSYLYLSAAEASDLAPHTARIASVEGLTAHARAAEARGGRET